MARLSAVWDALVGRHLVGLVALIAGALALIGAALALTFAAQAEEATTAVLRWRQIDERTAAIRVAGRDLVAEVSGPADPAMRADRVRREGDEIGAELDHIADEVGGQEPPSLAMVAAAADRLVSGGLAVIEATDDLVRLDAVAELDARSERFAEALGEAEAELLDRERAEVVLRYDTAAATSGRGAVGVAAILAVAALLVTVTRRLHRHRQQLEAQFEPPAHAVEIAPPTVAPAGVERGEELAVVVRYDPVLDEAGQLVGARTCVIAGDRPADENRPISTRSLFDDRVLEQVIADIGALNRSLDDPLWVSVPVSAAPILRRGIARVVGEQLADHDLDPADLVIEVVEGRYLGRSRHLAEGVDALVGLGVEVLNVDDPDEVSGALSADELAALARADRGLSLRL